MSRTNIEQMPAKLSTQEFIQRAKKLWGDKFDYTNTLYVDMKTPVQVICDVHHEITVNPVAHLRLRVLVVSNAALRMLEQKQRNA